jgi:hypothetical protein
LALGATRPFGQAGDFGAQGGQFAAQQHFAGREPRVFQDFVRHALLWRQQRLIVENERTSGTGQIIEFAPTPGFDDALFGEDVENGWHRRFRSGDMYSLMAKIQPPAMFANDAGK